MGQPPELDAIGANVGEIVQSLLQNQTVPVKASGMRKSHFAARRYGRVDKRWRRKVAATKGGKKDGALKGRRYDRKFEERANSKKGAAVWSYRKNGSEDPPLQRPTITEAWNQGG